MLRAVLSEVEVVLSSLSILRGSLEACSHLFELGCGSSAAEFWTVAFPRPEVDREGSPGVGAAVFLRRLTKPVLPPGQTCAGRDCGSLRSKLGPSEILAQSGGGLRAFPVAKAAKEAAQPGASSGRLPPFQSIMVCEGGHFEERLESAAKRR